MNSMSGPGGGYSGSYPGYVPPSALPYYNGYPADVSQSANPYYSKPGASVPPGYSSSMTPYSTPPINNSSMYYQQYGLGYQYSYGKYGLNSSLGYSPDIPSGQGAPQPPAIGTLQAPTTDLGLTGSMFSKNNKYNSSSGSSSPHSVSTAGNHSSNTNVPMPVPNTANTPSPGPHPMSSALRGPTATPSPPVENTEGKKDIDKMKRCQVCGQVFRLMSECLAHMKAVHEAPMSVYSLQQTAGGHVAQPPSHSVTPNTINPPTSRHGGIGTPDSPLMALERMGWGEKQGVMPPAMQSPSPYGGPPSHVPNMQQHQPNAMYNTVPHPHSISLQHPSLAHQQSPVRHSSPAPIPVNSSHSPGVSNQNSPAIVENNLESESSLSEESQKFRKNNYSVSSIIGESNEVPNEPLSEKGDEMEKIETPQETENIEKPENNSTNECQDENLEQKTEEETQVSQVSISEAVKGEENDGQKSIEASGPVPQVNEQEANTEEQYNHPAPEVVGEQDLVEEFPTENNSMENTNEDTTEDSKISENSEATPKMDDNEINENPNISEQEAENLSETAPEDLSATPSDQSNPSAHPNNPAFHQPGSLQTNIQRHPSPPIGTYPNQGKPPPGSYGNWPMPVGSSGYPGQYPYPQGSNGPPPNSGKPPHNYHSMHTRFPAQYHQGSTPPGQYPPPPPHGYMQGGHPSGGWYPRGDSKGMWQNWPNQGSHPYPQGGYYGYPNQPSSGQKPAPPPAHMHPPQHPSQKSPMQLHFNSYHPNHQNSPGSNISSPLEYKEGAMMTTSSPSQIANSPQPSIEQDGIKSGPRSRKSSPRIGPKSKIMPAKELNQMDNLDAYKCTITVQENGYATQNNDMGTVSAATFHSCDSSDSDMNNDEYPKFATLKTAKRKTLSGTETTTGFVGPKRIKLARQIKVKQELRNQKIQEKMRQSEMQEELQAKRLESAVEQSGPLGNVILQSSILLADKKVEGSASVEECIANIDLVRQQSLSNEVSKIISYGYLRRSAKKGQPKDLQNEKCIIIKDTSTKRRYHKRKLRIRDFKWSSYIKQLRYWCKDCAYGFKTELEATKHMEERCKINCLYMLECYVHIDDLQSHPLYGSKVQELLEEYQLDGNHHCMHCGDTIPKKADYLVHMDSHKDFMPWECTICGARFKIRGSLKEHLRYTHMKGRVPCLKCNKVFPTSTLLRQHVKVHTQHYKYKSGKNREEELRTAMEATAGAIEDTTGEENEKLSQEATEYRNWCKLMEVNALKNITVPRDEEEDDYDYSGDEMGYSDSIAS